MGESLYIALKESINRFGVDILKEGRLINILLDLGAFKDVPASKAILREMVLEGFCAKILSLGTTKKNLFNKIFSSKPIAFIPNSQDWKEKVKSIQSQIIANYGFREDLVDYVCTEIIKALGWIDKSSKEEVITELSQNHDSKNVKSVHKEKVQNYISPTQYLVVNVQPTNSLVRIDGVLQNNTNGMVVLETSIGSHILETSCDNYITQTSTIQVTKAEKSEVSVSLKLSNDKMKIIITPEDTDTEIYINDIHVGFGQWTGLVDAGDLKVVCSKNGCEDYERYFCLKKGSTNEIPIPKLKVLGGVLKVNVQPYGSDIFLNGENVGSTPVVLSNVKAGPYSLRVISNEGSEYTATVNITTDKVIEIAHSIPSIFFTDYLQVQIGDYIYEDGSFSHIQSTAKRKCGFVFSLRTSQEEKKHGWNHGMIAALYDADLSSNDRINRWGYIDDSLIRLATPLDSSCPIDNDKSYLINHLSYVKDNKDFSPFNRALNYSAKLPVGKTSGWYLPSVSQMEELFNNIQRNPSKYKDLLMFHKLIQNKEYATCSAHDKNTAWCCMIDSSLYSSRLNSKLKNVEKGWSAVRAVASF